MIDFVKTVVGALEANCYVIWDKDTMEGAVIDPGGDVEDIAEIVEKKGITVKYILLTHAHFDHTHGAGELEEKYNAPIAISPEESFLIHDDLGLLMYYGDEKYIPVEPKIDLHDGDVLDLGNSKIEVIATPGHSKGGVCFGTDAGVFCGDTIFAGSVGRCDLPGGSMQELVESAAKQILTMKDDVVLHPGHGPDTTVGRERMSNPYLAGL